MSAVAFDGMAPFELGCVVEIFGIPRPELDVPWYELTVCAETPADLRVAGGFTMRAGHEPRHVGHDDRLAEDDTAEDVTDG
ncbi:hypothetical protein ACFQ08_35930, partial [Streptosporangium algeriense]